MEIQVKFEYFKMCSYKPPLKPTQAKHCEESKANFAHKIKKAPF